MGNAIATQHERELDRRAARTDGGRPIWKSGVVMRGVDNVRQPSARPAPDRPSALIILENSHSLARGAGVNVGAMEWEFSKMIRADGRSGAGRAEG